MDVESLAKQLILKGMTEEQQKAVLKSIRESVQKTRELQKQKVGENAQLVIQALKKIESDIRDRYDDLGNKIEDRVRSIKDGKDGKDGRNGANGRDGRDGATGPMGPRGKDGLNGRDGKNGVDGVSVTDAHIDFDGSLIISLSSGRTINVGEVVAPDLAEKIKVITNGGGTSQAVLDTLASLQTQINNLIPSQTGQAGKFLTTNGSVLSWASVVGGLSYQGTWNASTNTPTLASGVGTNGYYYIVATAGSTNLDGITDWQIGDWLLFNGTVWQKIDQTNLVTSVNSQTGAVVLTTTNINEGTNLYYLDSRARSALSAGTGISYSTSTGTITNSAPDQTVALTGAGTTSISGTYPNFTITSNDQYQGTVTSVAVSVPTGLSISGSPITSSGTIAISLAAGYSIPTTTSQANWDTAYTDRLKWDGGATDLNATTGRTSLGLGTIATQNANSVSISGGSITGITDLAVADGGTGASTAQNARINLLPSYTSNANKVLAVNSTATDVEWVNAATGSGTVTSVAQTFTGGLISVSGSPITTSGTLALTVAGTSGGIPYFSSGTTWASSAALAANAVMVGGGAGAAPSTVTTGTGVVTALGVNTGTAGAFVVNGGALGTPSSGTVTNLTGTASININGTVGATTPNTGAFTTISATGAITASAGTASAPAITTSGDTNTGIFFPAADTIAFSEGGAEVARFDSSGNLLVGTNTTGSTGICLPNNYNVGWNQGAGESIPNIFRQANSAATVIANGYRQSTTANGFASSYSTSWAKCAISLGSVTGVISFYTDTATTTAAGTDLTPTERARITTNGEFYIAGTTDQGVYNLQVNGTGVWGAGAYVNGSDAALKEEVQDLAPALNVITSLRPVTFRYKEEYSKDQNIQPGFIAQELQTAMAGQAYVDGVVQAGPQHLNVAYQSLIPLLTKAIQEQQVLIQSMISAIQELKAELDATKAQVAALQAKE